VRRLVLAAAAALAALTAVSTAGAAITRTERVVRSQTGTHLWTYTYVDGRPSAYVLRNFDLVGRPLGTYRGALRAGGPKYATGTGRVFDPNPVAFLHDETLTDQKDEDFAALQPAYVLRPLTNLDGSGFLSGPYVDVSGTKSRAKEPSLVFSYGRTDDRFEQTEAYWAVNTAQEYIQSLGFQNVNNEPQRVKIDQWGIDNSAYYPNNDTIKFGTGGVDDAEDSEVIWHELGHAIQDDQVKGFGTTLESGSIGEGFGDYWAYTMSLPTGGGFDPACIADWDSTSYTAGPVHCLRRVDLNLVWPQDDGGEVHRNGRIWSRALHDINVALGRQVADRIIIEGQFSYTPDVTFAGASNATIAAAQKLYGSAAANACRAAFQARGFIS
jgi:Thermolysin metallopeptidase, alpha-helical domain